MSSNSFGSIGPRFAHSCHPAARAIGVLVAISCCLSREAFADMTEVEIEAGAVPSVTPSYQPTPGWTQEDDVEESAAIASPTPADQPNNDPGPSRGGGETDPAGDPTAGGGGIAPPGAGDGLLDRAALLASLCGDNVTDEYLDTKVELILMTVSRGDSLEERAAQASVHRSIATCLLDQLEKPNRGVIGKEYIIRKAERLTNPIQNWPVPFEYGGAVRCRLVGALTPYLTHPDIYNTAFRSLTSEDLNLCKDSSEISIPAIRAQLKTVIEVPGVYTNRSARKDAMSFAVLTSELPPAEALYLTTIMTFVNVEFNLAIGRVINPLQGGQNPPPGGQLIAESFMASFAGWTDDMMRSSDQFAALNTALFDGGVILSMCDLIRMSPGNLGDYAFNVLSRLVRFAMPQQAYQTVVDALVEAFLAMDADLSTEIPPRDARLLGTRDERRLAYMADLLRRGAQWNPDFKCVLSATLYQVMNDPAVTDARKKANALILLDQISPQ